MLGACTYRAVFLRSFAPRVLPPLARLAQRSTTMATYPGRWSNEGFVASTASTAAAAPPLERAAAAADSPQAMDSVSGMLLESPKRSVKQSASAYSPDLSKALRSVVKIFTTTANPNFSQPWQMQAQCKCTASGFAISPLQERRLLTNAHAVANQVVVKVRKHGSAHKYDARVIAVGHECDIAMLTVDDDGFWANMEPLDIAGLPAMQSEVSVVGFPQGGDNVCVTKGVVSRIDRQQYSHGRTALLAIQVDAAINSGNSGGPVLLGSNVVGIAFQCLTSGDGVGYVIPVPVINHFLRDLERNAGRYTGFCELGVAWQNLENDGMKRALGLPKGLTGVIITKTEPLAHANKVLRRGDVLTHLDGVPIADDGTFLFREAVRIDFRHIASQAFDGDAITARIWRGGRAQDVQVELRVPQQLVPAHSHDVRPDYYIYAGLLFTPLSCFYLRSQYGTDWASKAPIKLCERAFAGTMERPGQQVVVLSKVFAADINSGYQDISNVQLLRVDGVEVANLGHAAWLLEAAQGPFVKLELEWNKVLYIDHAKAVACASALLAQNSIPAPHSASLAKVPPPAAKPAAAAVTGGDAPAPSTPAESEDEDGAPDTGRADEDEAAEAAAGEGAAVCKM
ncbi:MAG: trypsin-like cysteine/serine peptidase domain-containing protein [Monoraphidium minutum]|nr:MAG: trypsin-like cysteine/serine peptidase domain-containing protein [Monoraphidium minutum]